MLPTAARQPTKIVKAKITNKHAMPIGVSAGNLVETFSPRGMPGSTRLVEISERTVMAARHAGLTVEIVPDTAPVTPVATPKTPPKASEAPTPTPAPESVPEPAQEPEPVMLGPELPPEMKAAPETKASEDASPLYSLSKAQLQKLCKAEGKGTMGSKGQLVSRLMVGKDAAAIKELVSKVE